MLLLRQKHNTQKFIFVVSVGLGALLSGCGSHGLRARHKRPSLIEAQLTDVPFPLGAQVTDEGLSDLFDQSSQAHHIVSYTTTLSVAALREFYASDMERLGWKELFVGVASDNEAVFVFTKPAARASSAKGRVFVVRAREEGRALDVRCFLGTAR